VSLPAPAAWSHCRGPLPGHTYWQWRSRLWVKTRCNIYAAEHSCVSSKAHGRKCRYTYRTEIKPWRVDLCFWRRRSTTTEAKPLALQGRRRQKFRKSFLGSASTSYRDFAWILGIFLHHFLRSKIMSLYNTCLSLDVGLYIITYTDRTWVCTWSLAHMQTHIQTHIWIYDYIYTDVYLFMTWMCEICVHVYICINIYIKISTHKDTYSHIFKYRYTFPHVCRIVDIKYSFFFSHHTPFAGNGSTTRVLSRGGCKLLVPVRPSVNNGMCR